MISFALRPRAGLSNLMTRHIATRNDVVFGQVAGQAPQLRFVRDVSALVDGWFW